jgi:di/tripeptidase
MKDIHTTREQLNVASAARTWDYLLAVLEQL